ncbi:CBS domain containing-hemolysin-like protein [Clostridium acetobutylicum]|uniref:Predicted membrane protein n=1 Tax=Clostridium acetobutylicum (strain ATCC 824 / DSM 792 / JCM 1419 / IAM 19013 / LMG 5710 / NBRC 13948 / NRRL B-527 / VKM B-1787 / 2291 / W) TaxID=272562 RepID=Q97HD4_CLOAB|nr:MULTISPECIES: hypothetical protein [Clostridium]AAK80037.1 Predicted membrane protein [Clostridium acetobutylicum ATCC 824]ADZ21129.1 membrane protein [Clostridium acetobutylicum EA 2018]AEI32171.1 hypothetical protein SMB_G2111 [Clostridium acetobutylicum DSM 1731]AWV79535.1 hypothetical protein DK921_05355 [Clostridium acetobutylicum]KHD38226.1 membrane protein [Clostridium acetobutylicum]
MSKNKKGNSRDMHKWLLKIFIWSITISSSVSLLSDLLLRRVNLLVAFILLICIIFIGIVFDIIGISVATAVETPFHAMAAKKIHGSSIAIKLIRNSDKVATFCNDVIGDICGIVSGTMGALITDKLLQQMLNKNIPSEALSAMVGGMIAAGTILGKAIGKTYGINNSRKIVTRVSKILYLVQKDR